jgi:hypothetical protein
VVAIVFPWSLTGGNGVQAEWEPDELIDVWTLTGNDWDLIANKAGVTRLGFAVMLKSLDTQTDSLKASGVTRIFAEKISTRAVTRP